MDIKNMKVSIGIVIAINAVINNEMRTIMSDHSGFAEALKQLELSGLLPSGEKRTYGNYGN